MSVAAHHRLSEHLRKLAGIILRTTYGTGVPIVCVGQIRSSLAQAYSDTLVRNTHRSVRSGAIHGRVRSSSCTPSPLKQLAVQPVMGLEQMMMQYWMQTLLRDHRGGDARITLTTPCHSRTSPDTLLQFGAGSQQAGGYRCSQAHGHGDAPEDPVPRCMDNIMVGRCLGY